MPTSHRAAFTLSELTLSMSIVGLLMLGVVSSLMVGTEVIPEPDDPIEKTVKNAGVADLIAEELRYSTAITERSDKAITFLVADRDGDRLPESIRYAWSGIVGDVLNREYKGNTVTVAHDVEEFQLDYKTITMEETYPGPDAANGEQVLANFPRVSGNPTFKVNDRDFVGQYFVPSLPSGATSWSVTRVGFEAAKHGPANGNTKVQLRTADGNMLPTDLILEQHLLPESSLDGSASWQEFDFASVNGLAPGDGLCLVLEWVDDANSAKINCTNGGSGRVRTSDGGATWSYDLSSSMICTVWGTAVAPASPQAASRTHVSAVRINLQSGEEQTGRQVTTTPMLNHPEALSAFWELKFDADPRLDHNGGGEADWVNNAGTFSPGSLVDEVWQVDSELATFPPNGFLNLTTIEMRARTTSPGSGAAFSIFADASGGQSSWISAHLDLVADGTQTLHLEYQTTATSYPLVSVPGLPNDFVTIRLVIDPDLDTVACWLGGVHVGTFGYSTSSFGSVNYAAIASLGADADIDHVSIRVSE